MSSEKYEKDGEKDKKGKIRRKEMNGKNKK